MPTFLSLFSGCGGFDLGFTESGFECKGAYDNDKTVVEVYKQNIGKHIYQHDLTQDSLPNEVGEVDVVISGSPCQGFSTVGLRKYEDPRNSLLLIGGKIAVKHNAKVFVAENVMGSLSGKHKIYWDKLIDFLENNGYNTQITICDASKIGLAQTRRRVILYAWKGKNNQVLGYPQLPSKSLKDVLSEPSSSMDNEDYRVLEKNSRETLIANKIKPGEKLCDVRGGGNSVHSWDIPEVFGECSDIEKELLLLIQKLRRRIRRRKNGDSDPVYIGILKSEFRAPNTDKLIEQLVNKDFLVEKMPGYYDIKRSFNGKYRRLKWNQPSYTIDTRFGNPRYFLHPSENRGFSVREAARIQGFNDDFIFKGGMNDKFKMIGNAVPPPMAKLVALNTLKLLQCNER